MSGNDRLDTTIIGPRIPGIRYRAYNTERGVFLLPAFPLSMDEEEIAARFLRLSGFTLRNWKAVCLAYWESCITRVPHEIGDIVVLRDGIICTEVREGGRDSNHQVSTHHSVVASVGITDEFVLNR